MNIPLKLNKYGGGHNSYFPQRPRNNLAYYNNNPRIRELTQQIMNKKKRGKTLLIFGGCFGLIIIGLVIFFIFRQDKYREVKKYCKNMIESFGWTKKSTTSQNYDTNKVPDDTLDKSSNTKKFEPYDKLDDDTEYHDIENIDKELDGIQENFDDTKLLDDLMEKQENYSIEDVDDIQENINNFDNIKEDSDNIEGFENSTELNIEPFNRNENYANY